MKDHVYYGTKVLIEMGVPDSIVKTIGQHHERLDGYGYPEGLRDDEITHFGRMIAIVDTDDAMTADRCYKVGMSSRKALQILLQDAPEKIDKALVTQFVQSIGIFPVGSLVKLNNQKIAMVLRQNFPIKSYTCSIYILNLDNDIKQKASKFSLDLVHIDVTLNASDDCYLFHDKKQ